MGLRENQASLRAEDTVARNQAVINDFTTVRDAVTAVSDAEVVERYEEVAKRDAAVTARDEVTECGGDQTRRDRCDARVHRGRGGE